MSNTHQTVSWIKSAVRILGYAILLINPILAVLALVGSEMIGILEEVGE